jgi:hypothetical protein
LPTAKLLEVFITVLLGLVILGPQYFQGLPRPRFPLYRPAVEAKTSIKTRESATNTKQPPTLKEWQFMSFGFQAEQALA